MKKKSYTKVLQFDEGTKVFQAKTQMEYKHNNLKETILLFELLKKDNVILKGEFQSIRWLCSNINTYRRVNFIFDLEDYKEFIQPVKSYVLNSLQQQKAKSVQMELNPLKKAIKITEGFKSDRIGYLEEYLINSDSKVRSYRCAYAVSQFLSFLDYYKYKNYIELCNVIEKPPRYTRKLVAFSDLIFFGEIINSFENNATVRELNSFFPVLLWWRLT
ncbi:TPA: site-specific integrase, partial [Bacillus cereus biovar anthracis]|nr:site-specific integrase [Bacillus cereus biovar anthracis]